jgi:Response regulator containing CheY-like receiver, AAA-type ATPase, and DNA-binding domains
MKCLPIAKELDLVIMDAKMQSKSGLETLIKLKNANPALSIIMITACSEMPLLGKAIKIGLINYYLTKPFDLDQIRNLVRALVKKSR